MRENFLAISPILWLKNEKQQHEQLIQPFRFYTVKAISLLQQRRGTKRERKEKQIG